MQAKAQTSGVAIVARAERVEAALWRKLKDGGDSTAREKLFTHYRFLARSIARSHAAAIDGDSASRSDLEQAAYRGLLQAIDRFGPTLNVPFPAFARPRIGGSVIEAKAQISEVGAQSDFRRMRNRERLRSLTGGSQQSKASALDRLADIAVELALALMLDIEEQRDTDLPGDRDNAFDSLAWRQMTSALTEHVRDLPDAERTVIDQHYRNDVVFAEIAVMLGVTRGRISQLHKSALQRLAKRMRGTR